MHQNDLQYFRQKIWAMNCRNARIYLCLSSEDPFQGLSSNEENKSNLVSLLSNARYDVTYHTEPWHLYTWADFSLAEKTCGTFISQPDLKVSNSNLISLDLQSLYTRNEKSAPVKLWELWYFPENYFLTISKKNLSYQVKDWIINTWIIPGRHHISEIFSWWPVLKFQHHWFFLIFKSVWKIIRITELFLFITQTEINGKLAFYA